MSVPQFSLYILLLYPGHVDGNFIAVIRILNVRVHKAAGAVPVKWEIKKVIQ